MNAPANVQHFLRFNHADARKLFERLDHIHLVAIMPDAPKGTLPHGKYFGSDVDAALAWAANVNGNGWGVYWTLNYVGPSVGTKPKKGDIQAARGAHCDLDPPSDGRAWDKGEAIGALADHASPPSLVIDSGNGLQPVWLLDEPAREWSQIEATNTGIRDTFGGDDCHNIDRLLRVPGSVNYPSKAKRARGYVPCMATWALEDTGQRYRPDDLTAAFPVSHHTDQRAPANDSDRVPTQTGALIAAIRRGDNWHNNMLRLTAHLVAKGRTTVEILAMADCLTLAGYTVDDTRADMRGMIEDARRKWEYAEPADPQLGYVDERGEWTAYGDDWQAPGGEAETPADWPALDLKVCSTSRAPIRQWMIQDWVPRNKATLLAGDGGVGKSLLAQIMATCVAASGQVFFGVGVQEANAAYISWEDDADELWRRQEAICEVMGISMESLAGRLHLVSLTEEQNPFLVKADDNGLSVTSLGNSIANLVQRHNIGLLILDNASQTACIDHNKVEEVAPFAHWLGAMAQRQNGAVVLLHHTNKAGQDYLGSVAYNNQFRSRMLLARPEDCNDPDLRELTNPKANYAQAGSRIELRWHRGGFVRDEDLSPSAYAELTKVHRAVGDQVIFKACLQERIRTRRAVSEKRSPSFAPTVFATMPESKKIGVKRLEAAMDALFRTGEIERAELWKGPDRKPVFGLRETAGNGAGNTMRETQ